MLSYTSTRSRSGLGRRAAALFYGAARAFDLGGFLGRHKGRFGQGFRGDALALRHDWSVALGQGYAAAHRHGEE